MCYACNNCGACGKVIADDSLHCLLCGAVLKEGDACCSSCGFEVPLPPGSSFTIEGENSEWGAEKLSFDGSRI